MANSIENLFLYFTVASDIIVILIFLAFFKKLGSIRQLYPIITYCLFSLISNYIGEKVLPPEKKYVFYTLFTLVEYSIFAFFIRSILIGGVIKQVIQWTSILFALFIICYLSFFKHERIDSNSIGIESILLMIFSFYYLYEQLNDTTNIFIYSRFEFWIVTGILIYLAGSFFIYIFASRIDTRFLYKYWWLTNVFYIIKNIFFIIGLMIYSKPTGSSLVSGNHTKLQSYLN